MEVEHLWKTTGYILREERASMGAENFEIQIFLKQNRDLWNLNDMPIACMKAAKERALGNRVDEIGT